MRSTFGGGGGGGGGTLAAVFFMAEGVAAFLMMEVVAVFFMAEGATAFLMMEVVAVFSMAEGAVAFFTTGGGSAGLVDGVSFLTTTGVTFTLGGGATASFFCARSGPLASMQVANSSGMFFCIRRSLCK